MVEKTAGFALKFLLGTLFFCSGFSPVAAQETGGNIDKYIIVLDVQSAFYKRPSLQHEAAAMIRNINNLTAAANPDKVIYIKAAGKALSLTSRGFSADTLTPDLDSNLNLVSNHIFTKMSGDAFAELNFAGFVKQNQACEFILTGMMAEKCIYNTAIGGLKRGYKISILQDAVMGSNPAKKEKALKKLEAEGIQIIPSIK